MNSKKNSCHGNYVRKYGSQLTSKLSLGEGHLQLSDRKVNQMMLVRLLDHKLMILSGPPTYYKLFNSSINLVYQISYSFYEHKIMATKKFEY